MTSVPYEDRAVCRYLRAHIAIVCRRLGKALEDIDTRNRTRDVLDGNKLRPHLLAQLRENMILERRDLLLRSEDLRLEVLQLLGDEALRIREGLLADVALGYLVAPAVAHLDVVAEDLVVADLDSPGSSTIARSSVSRSSSNV